MGKHMGSDTDWEVGAKGKFHTYNNRFCVKFYCLTGKWGPWPPAPFVGGPERSSMSGPLISFDVMKSSLTSLYRITIYVGLSQAPHSFEKSEGSKKCGG